MDLAEFLLARIAEDEETAQVASERASSYGWADGAFNEAVELAENEGALREATAHIARWDPARVLAECAAKRRIVETRAAIAVPMREVHAEVRHQRDYVLRLLALPYADHPDYREEWKP